MAKIRNGFVSNSSSSSFIINTEDVTDEQANMIINHMDYKDQLTYNDYISEYDEWLIEFKGDTIIGNCSMDNFDMQEFFEIIGIDKNKAEWETNG